MKIAYLMTGLGFSGGNMVIYDFANELTKRGHEVYIVTPHEVFQWASNSKDKIITNHAQPITSKQRLINTIKPYVKKSTFLRTVAIRYRNSSKRHSLIELTKKLIENTPLSLDVVVASYWKTAFGAASLSDRAIPMYHMQHYEELFMQEINDRYLARWSYGLPINLIANSTWLKNQIQQRFNRKPYLLNPPIDLNIYNDKGYDFNEKYQDIKEIKILSYSDGRHFKAFEDTYQVMKKVCQNAKKPIKWLLFGSHNPGKLDIPYEYVGKVFKNGLADLYRKSHIATMLSWYESFPLPPLEAMACGTVPVCTQYGVEDYAINQENSVVFLPRQIDKMAEGILDLIEKPEKMQGLAEKGISTALEYSIEKRTDKYEEILLDVKNSNLTLKFRDVEELIAGNFSTNS